MNLSEAILKTSHLTAPSVPELRYLLTAAQKVRDRWPDVDVPKNEREREALALKLRNRGCLGCVRSRTPGPPRPI
jgi:hypothetical protein